LTTFGLSIVDSLPLIQVKKTTIKKNAKKNSGQIMYIPVKVATYYCLNLPLCDLKIQQKN